MTVIRCDRYRSFALRPENGNPRQERYYLNHSRYLGAQKYYNGAPQPAIQFAVWSPNADNVEVVFGGASGYIRDNDGAGIDPTRGTLALSRQTNGIWQTNGTSALANFANFDRLPYMYRITKPGGVVNYKTDIYSRCQMGQGNIDPSQARCSAF